MPQRSPLSQIFDWLKSVFTPAPETPKAPREIVVQEISLVGREAAMMPLNRAHEIEDLGAWSLYTLRITPLSYRDRSITPIPSSREFWYLFLQRIPPSQRRKGAVVTLKAAGQELRVQRSQHGEEFGPYRVTVLHVGDRNDQVTWKPVYAESLRFTDDATARMFMGRLGRKLLTQKCAEVKWAIAIEEKLKRLKRDYRLPIGYNQKLWDEELVRDPFTRRER